MKLINRIGAFLVFFLLATAALIAQPGIPESIRHDQTRARSFENLVDGAKHSENQGYYTEALYLYRLAVQIKPEQYDLWYRLTKVAVQAGAYTHADSAYSVLLANRRDLLQPSEVLLAANIKYRLAQYDEAFVLYDTLLRLPSADPGLRAEAEKGQAWCTWAQDSVSDRSASIHFLPVDTGTINRPEYSEMAAVLEGETLYFSAYRNQPKAPIFGTDREWKKVYIADGVGAGVLAPEADHFNQNKRHTGHTAFNRSGNEMYYSECRADGNSAEEICELYRRKRLPGGQWGPAEKLPSVVNLPGTSNEEPAIGEWPGDSSEVLYFVSNRRNNTGKDIWYSRITPAGFTTPIPFDRINSSKNDVTPFYHFATKTFYYSTDGRRTLGGFDVFSLNNNGKNWNGPDHMDRPVNSGANDVFYSRSKGGAYEFWSSNRQGLQSSSENDCCYDIFAAGRAVLDVVAFNLATGDSLSGTTVSLVDVTSGTPQTLQTVFLSGYKHTFDIDPSRRYIIQGTKDCYTAAQATANTGRLPENQVVHLGLKTGKLELVLKVFDKETGAPMPDPVVAALALPGASLNPAQSDSKNAVYRYKLEYLKDYTFEASKSGYQTGGIALGTQGWDCTRDTVIQREIWLSRQIHLTVHVREKYRKYPTPIEGAQVKIFQRTSPRPGSPMVANSLKNYYDPQASSYSDTIGYEHTYIAIASKENFTTDSVTITTYSKDWSPNANLKIDTIIELTQLLPITLYFENAQPNPATMANPDPNERMYGKGYFQYVGSKQRNTYKQNYTRGMSKADSLQAAAEIDDFFEYDVRRGWNALRAFSEILVEKMKAGDTIVVELQGFASPLGKPEYNQLLTGRRAASVHDHFKFFDEFGGGDIYKQYYDRQLFVIERPLGEVEDSSITDDPKSPNSRYSPHAARARKLVIVDSRMTKFRSTQKNQDLSRRQK